MEYLPRNRIDIPLVQALQPMYFAKSLTVSAPYNLSENFITPNSTMYLIKSFIFNFTFLTFHTYSVYLTIVLYRGFTDLCAFLICFHPVAMMGFIMNYFSGVTKSEKAASIIINLQKIDKIIVVNHTRYTKSRFFNWVMVIGVVLTQISIATTDFVLTPHMNSYMAFVQTIGACFIDLDVVFTIFIVHCLMERMKEVLDDARRIGDDEEMVPEMIAIVFMRILKVYQQLKDVYTMAIAFYVAELFIYVLFYVQGAILYHRHIYQEPYLDKEGLVAYLMINSIRILKGGVLVLLLTRKVEGLHQTITEINRTCLLKLNCCVNVRVRRLCKTILRCAEARYSQWAAWGAFVLGAGLPPAIARLAAAYTVVVLQFDFL